MPEAKPEADMFMWPLLSAGACRAPPTHVWLYSHIRHHRIQQLSLSLAAITSNHLLHVTCQKRSLKLTCSCDLCYLQVHAMPLQHSHIRHHHRQPSKQRLHRHNRLPTPAWPRLPDRRRRAAMCIRLLVLRPTTALLQSMSRNAHNAFRGLNGPKGLCRAAWLGDCRQWIAAAM
jgi:hypothetical protein